MKSNSWTSFYFIVNRKVFSLNVIPKHSDFETDVNLFNSLNAKNLKEFQWNKIQILLPFLFMV